MAFFVMLLDDAIFSHTGCTVRVFKTMAASYSQLQSILLDLHTRALSKTGERL